MKKIFSLIIAVLASAFLCSATFAKNIDNSHLFQKQALKAGTSTASCSSYPTCIVITNLSSYDVFIEAPILQFQRWLHPSYEQALIAEDYEYKRIIITNLFGYRYDGYVPNKATITLHDTYVYGLSNKAKLAVKIK